jgi:hypothetical protein
MKKIISGLITVFILSSCSSKIYYFENWQSKPVTIDGKLAEWSNPLRFYDQETGINYAISNDRKSLYFCCSVSNIALQTKILRSGLEFGIDTLGGKTFPVSLKYPAGNSSVPVTNGPPEPGSTPSRSTFRMKLLAEATTIELTGFKPFAGKTITTTKPGDSGITAAITIDGNGIMNYEAVIPFSTFYKKELTPSDSNIVFNYQLKVKPVPGATRGDNSGNRRSGLRSEGGMRGAGMGGGGGMRGGGMRGGGMSGGGMSGGGGMRGEGMSGENRNNNFQKGSSMTSMTKTTIKLKLAYRK